jgi:hypothetical protein
MLSAVLLLLTWPLSGPAATPDGDADGVRVAEEGGKLPRQASKPRVNDRVARDESISWSEPLYRYGRREPALEELPLKGSSPEIERAAHTESPN